MTDSRISYVREKIREMRENSQKLARWLQAIKVALPRLRRMNNAAEVRRVFRKTNCL